MKNIRKTVLLTAVLILILTACGSVLVHDTVSETLGIDVSSGNEISNYDTHSGNGDGTSCVILRFDDDSVSEEIRNDKNWKKFPLGETAQILVYGISDETGQTGPYLNDDEGNPLVPEIQNGYYLLIDRNAGKDGPHGTNVTLGLYDTDTDMLYYCKLDT